MSVTERMTEDAGASVTEPRGTDSSSSDASWSRLFREPLLHFLLLGAALFVAYSFLGNEGEGASSGEQIVVSDGKIEQLAAIFVRTWQRPPTQAELQGLIDDHIREEAAYREGLSMGLDRDDTIIRRRIRQKLDFVAQDLASQLQPTDEELERYLQEHEEDFRVPARLSFRHVFFNPQTHDDDLAKVVSELVTTLRDDPSVDAREMGDRTLLDFGYENLSEREVGNLFGVPFASEIVKLEPGIWHGPIPSAYGTHVVIIDDFQPGRPRELDEVRDAVRQEWDHARREEMTSEFYETLLGKYEVVVQWPEPFVEAGDD